MKIINSRFGSRVLYFLQTEDRFWFSYNPALLMHLSGRKAKPDSLDVLQIACYGHTLPPRTHTEGLWRLFPGTCLSATADGIRQNTYRRLGYHNIAEDLDPAAYADEVFEAFQQSLIKKIHLSPVGLIGLSGGPIDDELFGSLVSLFYWFRHAGR